MSQINFLPKIMEIVRFVQKLSQGMYITAIAVKVKVKFLFKP